MPLGWVAQFAVWIAAAARDESGEGDAPGGLVGGIVAQVKAPADLVADVGIGAVDGLLVDADDVAALDRQGDGPIGGEELFGDLGRAGELWCVVHVVGAVRQQSAFVRAGRDHQRPLLDGRVLEREPYGQHLRVVRLFGYDAVVLVPLGRAEDGVAELVFGQVALGRLDAHVLDGIGIDLRANQRLDDVEQVRVGEGAEDGRPGPEGSVGLDVLKGQ